MFLTGKGSDQGSVVRGAEHYGSTQAMYLNTYLAFAKSIISYFANDSTHMLP